MQKKLYCSNCCKFGHTNRNCKEPVVSIGMIIIKLDDIIRDKILKINNNINFIEEINNYNYKRINNIKKIDYYRDKINILIIEKKHSLNYIEFIRGIYNVNDMTKLTKMFKLMSNNEINMIKEKDFSKLWNNLWNKTAKKKIYHKEYMQSIDKFNKLIKTNKLDELLLIKSKFETPEWEFPKGRKNINEKNLDCAIREIKEETTLDKSSYTIINLVNCFQDIFIGTNDILYKHIYYLSILNNNIEISNNKENKEVNDIKFVTIDNISNYIRYYNKSKIDLINKIFLLIINLCEDYNNNSYLEV